MKWTTHSMYVDLETGELLKKRNAKLNYIIKKKRKHGTEIIDGIQGTIVIINECERSTQGKLFNNRKATNR